jgi:hypothetical protein
VPQYQLPWVEQPQEFRPVDRNSQITFGLRRCIDARWRHLELAENAPVTTLKGGSLDANDLRARKSGIAKRFARAESNAAASVPSWTNFSNEASVLFVIEPTQNTDVRPIEVGSGAIDHFPYFSLAYSDAFFSSRWLNGVALPGGLSWTEDTLAFLLSVKNGAQIACVNGMQMHASAVASGFTLPANLLLFNWDTDSQPYYGYLCAAWDRALKINEALAISANPWQLFEPQQISVPQAAASGLPTLSNARAKAGSITSSGWISQITAS